jgi:hypothetical protein
MVHRLEEDMNHRFKFIMTVTEHAMAKYRHIMYAAQQLWNFQHTTFNRKGEPMLIMEGDATRAFADPADLILAITQAVWDVNGEYCKVSIQWKELDKMQLGLEYGEEDYNKYLQSKGVGEASGG